MSANHDGSDGALPLVHRYIAAVNSHDCAIVEMLYASDFEGDDVGQGAPVRGPRAASDVLRTYFAAFPDLEMHCDEMLAQDDRISFSWTARGTHRGPLMRIPATGRSVSVRGATFLTLRDGLITHAHTIWDIAGFLRGIGLLTDL